VRRLLAAAFLALAAFPPSGPLAGPDAGTDGERGVPKPPADAATVVLADDGDAATVVPTDDGDAVRELLYARPFVLERPYEYLWTAEKPEIRSGMILVVEVDPEYARPRQLGVPVLYVGARPAELANVGYESGRMIVIVPGDTDLAASPVYFGSTEFPERVDAERGRRELQAALGVGIAPPGEEELERAFAAGGDTLRTPAIDGVYRSLADVIMEYSPYESELAETYRGIPTPSGGGE
jgi:hypothetical protein